MIEFLLLKVFDFESIIFQVQFLRKVLSIFSLRDSKILISNFYTDILKLFT